MLSQVSSPVPLLGQIYPHFPVLRGYSFIETSTYFFSRGLSSLSHIFWELPPSLNYKSFFILPFVHSFLAPLGFTLSFRDYPKFITPWYLTKRKGFRRRDDPPNLPFPYLLPHSESECPPITVDRDLDNNLDLSSLLKLTIKLSS